MSNSIRKGFHTEVSSLFADDIRFKRASYYYFLGKIEPWGTPDVSPSQTDIDSQFNDDTVRSNTLFIKKITPNDISEVIPRHDWVSGTVFSKWDNTLNMAGVNFYALTTDNNVYKCLDNFGGAVSTVKPSGTNYGVISTADGYTWKYMYTIPAFKQIRFSSLLYIPVQKALTDSFYNKGAITQTILSAGGSGYANTTLTSITITGTTTGSGASGKITVGAGGIITGATITSGGSGYVGSYLTITTVGGIGGKISPVIVSGVITGITVDNGGYGYAANEVINFIVGGGVLVPLVSAVTGTIDSVKIVDPGIGYVGNPTLSVVGTGGTGKYGNSTALLTCVVYQNKIVSVSIVDPGVTYPSGNTTTIVVQGNGTGAVVTPVIFNGILIGGVIENQGTGYTSITLNVVGTGTGAILLPIVNLSDFTSDQSIVEQTSIAGAIYSVQPTTNGSGYTSTAIASIVGDGTGCTITPVVLNGSITNFIVTNAGSKYTYGNVIISDPNRAPVGVVDCVAYVILPPRGGHGRNAVIELGGNTILINSPLRKELFLNNIVQDFRQFGLIKNPRNFVSGALLTGDSYLAVYFIKLDTVAGLLQDQILTLNNTKFRVVYIDTGNRVYIEQLGNQLVSPIGILTGVSLDSSAPPTYVSSSIISSPTFDKYSGSLLYVSNESPFTLTDSQSIVIKTLLTF